MIRQAEPSDYQPIIAVINYWWGGRRMADMLPRLFFVHFRPTSFVAENQGHIVGFIVGFVSQTLPREAYIHFAGVHPEFRQKGLGRSLYEKFFMTVEQLGCDVVRCVTSPMNTNSIAFHKRLGFSPADSQDMADGVPVIKDYDGPGEDRVLFFKILANRGN